jgi:TetR/AcrR family transcriptional regulator of autoinduction and epiphytic fitness
VLPCAIRVDSNVGYDTMRIMAVKRRPRAARRRNPVETRRRILESAHALFAERGYTVTLSAIADRAGVSVQTVYFTFHTKGELLMQVVLAVGADDPDAPRHQVRAWYREMLSSTDARRQLALLSEHGTDIFARIAPLIGLVDAARASDPDLAAAWQQTVMARRDGMREQMEVVARNGALRPDLDVDAAADLVFVLQRPETLHAFTIECGWSIERYKAWLYETLCQQLLVDRSGGYGDPALATAGMSFAAELHRSAIAMDDQRREDSVASAS